ncbi:MAG: hypothetical protein ACJ8FN_09980 [Sphingomicrobium sp.]
MADQLEELWDMAERFRRLATVVEDERNRRQLLELAAELDAQAEKLEEVARRKQD